MIKLLDNSKVQFFDYFYLLVIILYAGQASAFVQGFGDVRNIGCWIPLVLSFLFVIHKRIAFRGDFYLVLLVFFIYSGLTIATTRSAYGFLFIGQKWLLFLFVTYIICKGYGYKFFVLAETIIYHLAIIGLICWVFLLIIPGPFTSMISSIALPAFNEDEQFKSANALFYTIILSSVTEGSGEWYSIIRNSGFAWEPGAYSCFLCFAICFNALRKKGITFKNNSALVIFLVSLLSTESTTGYATFGIMLTLWLIENRKFGWLIVLIPVMLFVLNLPFMGEKLEVKTEGFSDVSLMNASTYESYDRILSFNIYLDEFKRNPLFGYGYSVPEFEKYDIRLWGGLGRFLAQYGIFISLLFLWLLIKTSNKLNSYYSNRSGFMIIPAILGMMVSYNLWFHPFVLAIWLSCLFLPDVAKNLSTPNPRIQLTN